MNIKSLPLNLLLFVLSLLTSVGAGLVIHDTVFFSKIRSQIDQQLAQASRDERYPSDEVRKAFDVGDPSFVPNVALDLYRQYWWSLPEKEQPSFESAKLLAVPIWALQLNFWYRRSDLETYRIHMACYREYFLIQGCDDLSERLYGRSLNALPPKQLACIRAFHRFPRTRECPELATVPGSGLQ